MPLPVKRRSLSFLLVLTLAFSSFTALFLRTFTASPSLVDHLHRELSVSQTIATTISASSSASYAASSSAFSSASRHTPSYDPRPDVPVVVETIDTQLDDHPPSLSGDVVIPAPPPSYLRHGPDVILRNRSLPASLQHAPPPPGDLCLNLDFNPNAWKPWQFNSRTLCVTQAACVPPFAPGLWQPNFNPSKTRCAHAGADLRPMSGNKDFSYFGGCSAFRWHKMACAYGGGLYRDPRTATCPNAAWNPGAGEARWLDGTTIFVPRYPFPSYIYHFVNVVTTLTLVAENLPNLLNAYGVTQSNSGSRLNIVFLSPRNRHLWQKGVMDVLFRQHIERRYDLHVYYSKEHRVSAICGQRTVLLGRRAQVNLWPFLNSTSIEFDGRFVPKDSVEFRRAFYKEYSISGRLPQGPSGISELPPMAVGYSRRLGPAAAGGNVHTEGSVRRFSPKDEEWFAHMLEEETRAAGATLKIFATDKNETLEQQIRKFGGFGFVIGIHGANLLNAIFMRPFGVMLEIFPNGADSECYWAGSNSGLMYMRHESTERATPEESGCLPEHKQCWIEPKFLRQRMVKLGSRADRDGVRMKVRKGLRHLRTLRRNFPNGIPVDFKRVKGGYQMP